MKFKIIQQNNTQIAELISDSQVINSIQDALDLIGNADYQGARKIILREEHLTPDFFDLKTRLAGEILQKFSNYRMSLAIVGDFSKYPSGSLKDFIRESNQNKRILFVPSVDELKKLW